MWDIVAGKRDFNEAPNIARLIILKKSYEAWRVQTDSDRSRLELDVILRTTSTLRSLYR